jgi:hypothetical protein
LENADARGASVVVKESAGVLFFLIQSRGVAFIDEERVLKGNIFGASINISTTIGIRFCPFCGTRLEGLIGRSPDLFRSLAQRHRLFLGDS